jgi:spermidine/putrescine-binding protein
MKSPIHVLASLAGAFALSLIAGTVHAQEEEKVLNIYNWSDYIGDDTIKNFEKETTSSCRRRTGRACRSRATCSASSTRRRSPT